MGTTNHQGNQLSESLRKYVEGTGNWDQYKLLQEELRKDLGTDYELFENARIADLQSRRPADFLNVCDMFSIFKEYRHIELSHRDAYYATPDELRRRIKFHEWLSRNRLVKFYDIEGVDSFKIQNQYVKMRSSTDIDWYGGVELFLRGDDDVTTMRVCGSLDTDRTVIGTVRGRKGYNYTDFKKKYEIHMSNLLMLLFMKLGQLVGHDSAKIMKGYHYDINRPYTVPAYYNIARNNFRLRPDPRTGNFQFNGSKRDSILEKSTKNKTVSEAFDKLKTYVNSLESK